jgi:glucokinase
MILAGDIGGTNTRLAVFEIEDQKPRLITEQTYPSREYGGLEVIVAKFLCDHPSQISRACFGVAGPVIDCKARTANLPWVIDCAQLTAVVGDPNVLLINDLEANAWGLSQLEDHDFLVLNQGQPDREGNGAIISAGTGLGEAGLIYENGQRRPFASEGGHADFAPRTELEVELLRFLMKETGHVSNERVLSGPGLVNVYRFLRDTSRFSEPSWLADEMQGSATPAAVISRAALSGKSDLCVAAVEMMVSIYGAEAGNLALKMLATAGVYIGGGIAPKIADKLKGSQFMDAFTDKGRMRPLLEAIPVRVVMNDQTALLGSAMRATFD